MCVTNLAVGKGGRGSDEEEEKEKKKNARKVTFKHS